MSAAQTDPNTQPGLNPIIINTTTATCHLAPFCTSSPHNFWAVTDLSSRVRPYFPYQRHTGKIYATPTLKSRGHVSSSIRSTTISCLLQLVHPGSAVSVLGIGGLPPSNDAPRVKILTMNANVSPPTSTIRLAYKTADFDPEH